MNVLVGYSCSSSRELNRSWSEVLSLSLFRWVSINNASCPFHWHNLQWSRASCTKLFWHGREKAAAGRPLERQMSNEIEKMFPAKEMLTHSQRRSSVDESNWDVWGPRIPVWRRFPSNSPGTAAPRWSKVYRPIHSILIKAYRGLLVQKVFCLGPFCLLNG